MSSNDGFYVLPDGLNPASMSLHSDADYAAGAGMALLELPAALGPVTGEGLHQVLTRFSQAWIAVLTDLMGSMVGLAGLVTETAQVYLSTEDEVTYQFGQVSR